MLGLSLGSLALLMLHRQLGGAWGFLIRRPLEAGAMTLPLMLVLFIPVLVDLGPDLPLGPATRATAEIPRAAGPPPRAGSSVRRAGRPRAARSGSPTARASVGARPGPAATRSRTRPPTLFDFKKLVAQPDEWFTVRVAIYFAIWIVLALVLEIGSRRQDETGSADLAYGLQSLSARAWCSTS